MIEQASQIPDGTVLDADICIIGAGAAGISMALELSGRGRHVLLMEAGGEAVDERDQAMYAGELADERMHSPPDKYRVRRFGGSTTIWGGRCMPFDPIDLERRDWIPHSGWPIGFAEVDPWFAPATEYLEAGEPEYDARRAFRPEAPPLIEGFRSQRVRTEGLERFSCPTDLGRRYRARLALAEDIRVVLGANATALRLTPDASRVDTVDFATHAGPRFKVRAREVVLATGGLEAPRLLLASNDVMPRGVGNTHDVVGRYYMCHIAANIGSLVLSGKPARVRHGYEISPDGIYCRRRLHLTESEQRRLRVPNMVMRLHIPKIVDPAHRNGVLSGLFLSRFFISYEYGKRLKDGQQGGVAHALRHVRNVILDPIDTVGFLLHWIRKRTLATRKFPSVILRNRSNRFSLEVHAEQVPLADSRVTLSDRKDPFGMPRLRVDWRYSPEDIEGVRRTLKVVAEDMAASGVGTYEFDEDTLETELMRFGAFGGHHVGTTRMGDDPSESVVDRDCRVHGVANLFIASSSVFPTSSQANPTLMIVAMALRLAHHLLDKDRAAPAVDPQPEEAPA